MAKTSLGFESMTGHRNHIAVLWVLMVFVLVTVLVTTYGGQMEKLPEREFPKTQIHDDLRVDGTIRMDNGPKLNHVKLYTDASFTEQGLNGANQYSNLVTSPRGTTAYRLPANAAISNAYLFTPAGVSSTNTSTHISVGLSTVSDGIPDTAFAFSQTLITSLDTAGDTVAAAFANIDTLFVSQSAQYVTVGVSGGTSLTSGSLEVDLYYYKY